MRLDRRTVYVTAISRVGFAVVVGAVGAASSGTPLAWVALGGVLLLAAGIVAEYVRWRVSRYRVTAERLERRFDFITHQRRSLARERIRSVDIAANLVQRLFGLAVVTIGTGQQNDADRIKLDPVSHAEAERLRAELLRRRRPDPGTQPAQQAQPAEPAPGTEPAGGSVLARLDWSWIRYAPASFVAPLLGAAAFGAVLNASGWFGLREGVLEWSFDLLSSAPIVFAVVTVVVIAVVVGLIGSLVIFAERWWDYRLDREPGGTLRIRRGLLTTRSISIEERRLRGVEVVEPLGIRLVGAARVDAVMTGIRQNDGDSKSDLKTLAPPVPRAFADQVTADVLTEEVAPTVAARLAPHPRAARGRRLRWALLGTLIPTAILAGLGASLTGVLLHLAWIWALVVGPIAVLLALDAYRNLGHGITGGYLVARSGAARRGTVALQRSGIIGWTARQSIFQRRAGLITLSATTAAGSGAYSIFDVAQGDGLAFAERAVPDLFGPFLERDEPGSP
ncbi:PH domain-containing protein [Amycolatopsis cihanbeyliensis]|uniref:PH domain-containing protein n=1 Tax=Amycolatopsis cihanbeyliensis TaxID=1128664 RepID=UPI00114E4494|nr:PH domain-containing protein [Amycolatopsis cihanbeyliensis]